MTPQDQNSPHSAVPSPGTLEPIADQSAPDDLVQKSTSRDSQVGEPTESDGFFGSFWIDETEFALPVSVIQEVVNEPEQYSPVPLSPTHVIGLFTLRKAIVQVVDLRSLLGFPETENPGKRKIAIIDDGDLHLGLLFDDTGGVLNSAAASRVAFKTNSDGEKDVIIEGVLKFDNGVRLVQLLDPFEILKIKRVPRVSKSTEDKIKAIQLGQRLNCISFQLGHTTCAIDLRFVQEITDMPELQHSQLAHGHVLGNVELRGLTMPVVDFRGLIGDEKPYKFHKEALSTRKLLVLSLPEGRVGLVVYSIDSIMTFYEKDILPFSNVALPRHDIVAGCLIGSEEKIVILLDHDRLLRDDALALAAQSCQEIYPSQQNEVVSKKLYDHLVRSTYVLFSIDMQIGLDISCVNEIIDRPETLLRPPYALKFVDGILNLRGELITLIDPRVLYGLPTKQVTNSKVLIFHSKGRKYGMVVDTVDEIVTTNTNELLDVPAIKNDNITKRVSVDVAGCLKVPNRKPESDPVLILDEALLISRCVGEENFERTN